MSACAASTMLTSLLTTENRVASVKPNRAVMSLWEDSKPASSWSINLRAWKTVSTLCEYVSCSIDVVLI